MRTKVILSKEDEKNDREWIFVNGALIAIGIIILQDYITTGISSATVFIAVLAFSISIPILAGNAYILQRELNNGFYMKGKISNLPYFLGIIGVLLSSVGIIATFWHLSWIAGVLFLGTAIAIFTLGAFLYPSDEETKQNS